MEEDTQERAKGAAMYEYLTERFPEGIGEEEYVPVNIRGHHFDVNLQPIQDNTLTFDLYYQGHEYVWRSFQVYANGEVAEEDLPEDEEADSESPQVHGPNLTASNEEIAATVYEAFLKHFPLH